MFHENAKKKAKNNCLESHQKQRLGLQLFPPTACQQVAEEDKRNWPCLLFLKTTYSKIMYSEIVQSERAKSNIAKKAQKKYSQRATSKSTSMFHVTATPVGREPEPLYMGITQVMNHRLRGPGGPPEGHGDTACSRR